MFSAISGLRSQQEYLDIIGNNIANVNTTAFKANRATFAETLWQTSRTGSAPQTDRGGINPIQIGLGTTLAGSDPVFSQGDLRSTGKISDLAIEGNGFFVYADGSRNLYSRDGSLDIGVDGTLLNPATGLRVMGWTADATGAIDTTQPLGTLTIPVGSGIAATQTGEVAFGGNLDSNTAAAGTVQTTMEVYDSLGNSHTINLTFTKSATSNAWTWSATGTGVTCTPGSTNLAFTTSGALDTAASGDAGLPTLQLDFADTGIEDPTIQLDLSSLTQFADTSGVNVTSRDGNPAGTFVSCSIDAAGVVTATYSNGRMVEVGQLAMADFRNPAGLLRAGNNLYELSANSGDPLVGAPGTQGLGQIRAGFLEMSNVDLAQQFTNMIVASRGFQANSRVIGAADEMLQELVNLRR